MTTTLEDPLGFAPTTMRRSPIWRGPANMIRRSATPRRIAGRIMSARRSSDGDFPPGNSVGKPRDPYSRGFTLELALHVLETAPGPQTTVQAPLRWSADACWKRDDNNVATLSTEELARRRREFDAQKEIARGLRESAA